MNKVLIITYYWPPSGGAGVQRWLKFSKYLPLSGWEPIILTVDPRWAVYPQQDHSLTGEISPSLKIIRTRSSAGFFSLYKLITGRKEIPYGGFANEDNPGFLQKFSRFIRGNFVLPDARRGWNRFAFRAAIKIIKEEKIDYVITTSPPHSTQLTGLKLKKTLKIRWIADLRDPWTDIYYSGTMYQTCLAGKINSLMEKKVIDNADHVITTCNAATRLFRSKLDRNQPAVKITTLTNGYDPADFNFSTLGPESFTITYLGTFAGNYDAEVLAEALDYLGSHSSTITDLVFIGKTDSKVQKIFGNKKMVNLRIVPYMEHKKAMEYLTMSVALLLVVPTGKNVNEPIPGKLFEYLAAKRKIIALAPKDSDVAEILEQTESGKVFGLDDSGLLGKYLVGIFDDFRNGIYESNPEGIEKYTRQNLAVNIAGILNSLK